MSNEAALRALVATKQLEINKLKRKIKELEDQLEQKRIEEGGWNSESRLGNTKDRKKNKRSKQSDISDK